MTDTTMSLLPAALRIAGGREMKFAAGLDEFGLRACRADFTSSRGYRWPFPGRWAEASGPFNAENTYPCPDSFGDGICVATTWDGMASGGLPATLVLLVGWKKADVLGRDRSKVRVRRAFVIDALTLGALLAERHAEEGADLRSADLRSADLYSADLRSANLRSADLRSANLRSADLRSADLRSANLRSADLRSADLGSANLTATQRDYAKAQGAYLS